MSKINTKEVVVKILVGLPGAGKSTFSANEFKRFSKKEMLPGYINSRNFGIGSNGRIAVVDFDSIGKKNKKNYDLSKVFSYYGIWECLFRKPPIDVVVFDGLFLRNSSHSNFVKIFASSEFTDALKKYDLPDDCVKLEFHYWEPDRDACLHNDKYRRLDLNSETTIKSAEIDEPDIDELRKVYPYINDLVRHTTVRKDNYQLFKDRYGLSDCVKSESWCLGGTSGSCWDDTLSTVSPSGDQPSSMKEFYELLEKLENDGLKMGLKECDFMAKL